MKNNNNGKEQYLIGTIDNQNYNKFFKFKEEYTEIVIKLKGLKFITIASNMFKNCAELISLTVIGKWNTSKVTNIKGLFFGCWTLLYIYLMLYQIGILQK